jgi:hypothetical protein
VENNENVGLKPLIAFIPRLKHGGSQLLGVFDRIRLEKLGNIISNNSTREEKAISKANRKPNYRKI